MKSYLLFVCGVFYGVVLTMFFNDLMPFWLMVSTAIAITIICICLDKD